MNDGLVPGRLRVRCGDLGLEVLEFCFGQAGCCFDGVPRDPGPQKSLDHLDLTAGFAPGLAFGAAFGEKLFCKCHDVFLQIQSVASGRFLESIDQSAVLDRAEVLNEAAPFVDAAASLAQGLSPVCRPVQGRFGVVAQHHHNGALETRIITAACACDSALDGWQWRYAAEKGKAGGGLVGTYAVGGCAVAAALPSIVLLLKARLQPEGITKHLGELAVPSPSGTAPWSRLAVRRIIKRWCDGNGGELQPKPHSREWDYERFVRAYEGTP